MHRANGIALVWTALLVFAGCDEGGYYDNRYGPGYYDDCQRFSSCGECTPIIGCGWCTYGQGQGVCLSDPTECRTQQFSWTWESKGCVVPDAGNTTQEAGNDGSSGDGSSATCNWPAGADTFTASDAGAMGCLPSPGDSLCASSQYALTCYGSGAPPAAPDGALNCVASQVPAPPNVAFHCCPCAP